MPADGTPSAPSSLLEAGGPLLAELLRLTEGRLAEVAGSHRGTLARHAGDVLDAGGKRLRPALVFLVAGAAGLDRSLVHAAVAVELLHTATLVHDDVLDRATLRRGRPTVYRDGGRRAATATGDLLFSRAFGELALTGSVAAAEILSAASSALARGELMQRADAWLRDVTRARYLERCRLKTASLFEAACRLGATFGAPGTAAADALGSFGERIGLAFQLFDDVLDVSGSPERTGKPRGTDLLDGTVTLPLIVARERDREVRGIDVATVSSDPGGAQALCDRIMQTGALEEVRAEARGFVAQAKAALTDAGLPRGQHEALERVAEGVVERYA